MVKIGIRKPSLKKSVKARTTGKAKRAIKRSIDPTYGKKGVGWVKDPKKAAYNKVYNKTTKSVTDSGPSGKRKSNSRPTYSSHKRYEGDQRSGCGCWTLLLAALIIPIMAPFFPVVAGIALFVIAIVSLVRLGTRRKDDSQIEQEDFNPTNDGFEDEHWDDF